MKKLVALAATAMIASTPVLVAPTASALPPGVSMQDVQAALSGPISVPAGQTTSVSLPVPVNASYNGGGWSVSSGGNSVSITAPPEGGQISVPVTSGGRSATITLVAEPTGGNNGGAQQPGAGNDGSAGTGGAGGGTGAEDQSGSQPGSGQDGQGASSGEGGGASDNQGASGPAVNNAELPVVPGEKPQRQHGGEVNTEGAERINLESTIEGNTITAKMGVTQALDIYNRFKDYDREAFTLRYVDADGSIIQDVERDIQAAQRTLVLTYPEGQAPDNPFIMQLVRKDGTGAEVVVTLRDPNYQSADASEDGTTPEDSTVSDQDSSSVDSLPLALIAAAVGIGLLVLLGLILLIRGLRRGRNK